MDRTTFLILACIVAEPRSASAIRDETARSSGGKRAPIASFYRALGRAHDAGWLEVRVEPGPSSGGRPPQTYRITAAGHRAIEAEAEQMRGLADLVSSPVPSPRESSR